MSESENVAQALAEGADEVTQSSSRRGRKRSLVWNHFEELPLEGKVICIHCKSKLKNYPGLGISHLKSHVQFRCKLFPANIDRNSIFGSSGSTTDVSNFVVDPKVTRDFMTKFWINANVAFKKIEDRFFKKMMKSAHPSLEVHGRQTLRNDCMSVWEVERRKVADGFACSDSRVSFTTDMWTSVQDLGYICLTAHYIDNEYKLHNHTINFKQVPHPHNSTAIHSTIMECLYEWDLSNKAFAFTLDNATSNNNAVGKLKGSLWGNMPFRGQDLHIRCTAHILNLIVQDGMKTIRGVIDPVRNVIKHIASSSSRLQFFNTLPQQYSLRRKKGFSLDVSTRWNSTYDMLVEAIKYREVLSRYADLQSIQGPSLEQWNLAERVCNFLENFAEATKAFSAQKFPTSHRYLEEVWGIRELLLDYSNQSDDFLKVICDDMKTKFDKYWDEPNKILLIASLLDPRYKLSFMKYCLTKAYGAQVAAMKTEDAMVWFKAYYAHYEGMVQISSQNNVSSSPEVSGSTSMVSQLSGKRKLGLGFALFKQQSRPHHSRRSEIDTYLEDPLVPVREGEYFEVLKWWKTKADQYPILARMTRDFLAIPLSTVASESTFSTAGMIIDKYRNSLGAETVEALICTKDWLKAYNSDGDDDNDSSDDDFGKKQ